MKILVVTYLFSALRDAITKDDDDSKGMPGFIKATKYFSDNGVEIDYIFITTKEEDKNLINCNSLLSHIKGNQIKDVIIKHQRSDNYTLNLFLHRKINSAVKKQLKNNKYDFIYAMTPETVCVNKLANKRKIPCGMRLYGSFLWGYYNNQPFIKTLLRYRDEISVYNTKKSFLITTDDGSDGEKSYARFARNKNLFNFQFLKNGLDRIELNDSDKLKKARDIIKNPSLLYVATITPWKRHDRAIELIKLLKERGIDANLYLVGSMPQSQAEINWKNELDSMIESYSLKDNVKFLGSLKKEEFLYYSKVADICALFQDTTNMGNVFHELFGAGAVIMSLDDTSLDDFIVNGKNGFLVKDMNEAAHIAEKIFNKKIDTDSIRKEALKTSCATMCTWDERFKKELELIKNAVKK